MFPRYALQAFDGEARDAAVAALLHRICRVYAIAGLAVPAFGITTGEVMGVMQEAWLIASLALTIAAAALLAASILPRQRHLLAVGRDSGAIAQARAASTRLSMLTGIFNALCVMVVILMILRPGSTTG